MQRVVAQFIINEYNFKVKTADYVFKIDVCLTLNEEVNELTCYFL